MQPSPQFLTNETSFQGNIGGLDPTRQLMDVVIDPSLGLGLHGPFYAKLATFGKPANDNPLDFYPKTETNQVINPVNCSHISPHN